MTRVLVRAYLRRSRWGLATWVLLLGGLPAVMAITTRLGYPTQADLDAFTRESMANLAEVAVRGPSFEASVGGLVAW
ncbi:MAG: ABC transporter permease, partial [Gammaproteobacteria bacterium]|nr:ABC transporter permease [Gammaproteobacteria bacterium]